MRKSIVLVGIFLTLLVLTGCGRTRETIPVAKMNEIMFSTNESYLNKYINRELEFIGCVRPSEYISFDSSRPSICIEGLNSIPIKMEIFEGLTMETKGYLEIKFDYGTSIPEVGSVVLVTAIWKNKYNTWLDGKRWEYVQK